MAGARRRCASGPASRTRRRASRPSPRRALAVARRDQRRPDGPRHRARRLGAARARQGADVDGDARGGDRRHPRPRRGPAGRATRAPTSSFDWTRPWKLPVWVAGYGPMALAMTGRVADGVMLQLADPDLIRWFVGAGPRGRGRRRPRPRLGPGHGRGAGARRRSRDLPGADALVPGARVEPRRRPRQQVPARALPEALTGYIRDRTGYDYHHHAEVGSSNAGFVGDEVTDRFCVLGSVDEHLAKLRELAGGRRRPVQRLPDERRRGAILDMYGREIIPALAAVPAGRT